MKQKQLLSILIFFIVVAGSMVFLTSGRAEATEKKILATTFPIFQIVRNVTQGRDTVKIDLMLPSHLGCPHNYALNPQDMQKLAKADVLVINGLGMEEFLGAPVKKVNPRITVIDSSAGIRNTMVYSGGPDHHPRAHAEASRHNEKTEHNHVETHHSHTGTNPHLFASPKMTALLALNIASELSRIDPEGAALYSGNARAYADNMNQLAQAMAELGKRLKNNRIVQPHGVFDYLARDIGLTIVAVMQPHGQEPSASEMMHLVKTIRKKQVGAIFTEPQYPGKIGNALSKETGVPVAVLDPVATGPENAPPAYYETVMRQNIKTIESVLGVR